MVPEPAVTRLVDVRRLERRGGLDIDLSGIVDGLRAFISIVLRQDTPARMADTASIGCSESEPIRVPADHHHAGA